MPKTKQKDPSANSIKLKAASGAKKISKDVGQLRLEILQKITDLVTAGMGLVAALAWNNAIQAIFNRVFPKPGDNIAALTVYALVITIIIVVITVQLSRAVNMAKKQLNIGKSRR